MKTKETKGEEPRGTTAADGTRTSHKQNGVCCGTVPQTKENNQRITTTMREKKKGRGG